MKSVGKLKASERKNAYNEKIEGLYRKFEKDFAKELDSCRLKRKDRMNIFKVLVAPMRFGKTRIAITFMIPLLLRELDVVDVVIISSPLKGILEQKKGLLKSICVNNSLTYCETCDQVEDALEYGDKAVFATTNSMAFTSPKSKKLLGNIDLSRVAYIVDECHTWTTDCPENVPDVNGGSGEKFLATLYDTVKLVSAVSPYIFGLTATANNQHNGFVPALGNMKFEKINTLPDVNEFVWRMGWMRPENVHYFEQEGSVYGDQTDEFFGKMIFRIMRIEKASRRKRCAMIETRMKPRESKLEEMDLPPNENPHIKNDLQRIKESDFSFDGMNDSDGITAVMTAKEKYICNKNGDDLMSTKDGLDEKTIYERLYDQDDPLRFLIIIDMAKMGVDLPTVKEFFSTRPAIKSSKVYGWIIETALQKFGRLLTVCTGILASSQKKGDDIFFEEHGGDLRDVPDFTPEMNEMHYTIIDNDFNRTAMQVFQDVFAPNAPNIGHYFFENSKKSIVPSGQERDAAYKEAQKDRCERTDCKCFEDFVENPPENSEEFSLSYEERLENYEKGLQIDHVDRNLENLAPENLKTYCPNAHSGKTMKYEDYIPK